MNASSENQNQPGSTGPKGRRTERIMLEIPIRVTSYGGATGGFTEDTRTLMINRDGGLIVLNHPLVPDETIRIVNLENLREADFRVVGLARQDEGGCTEWGVECLDRDRSLWEIDFPPPLDVHESKGGALLQCRECGKQSLLVLSFTEVGILEANASLERLCERCGQLTSWIHAEEIRLPKRFTRHVETAAPSPVVEAGDTVRRPMPIQASPDSAAIVSPIPKTVEREEVAQIASPVAVSTVTQAKAAPAPQADASLAAPRATWDGKAERRAHKRLTLKLPVQVRNQKGETELERTENISKGGLAVGLTMVLVPGERVTLVCPYTVESQQIEQKAEVMRHVSLYGGQKWFYGFRYIHG